jgi:hypothetical protein
LAIDRPTGLALVIFAGALSGLIWGKKIWAAIESEFGGGWGPKPKPRSDDVNSSKRHDEESRKL